ncbi:MAG: YkgJ family cysteine cluster protein [Bacteroidetes bacterium]|nr:YkgJ family cysteine cluster protein [Bacteroidota bacterium]
MSTIIFGSLCVDYNKETHLCNNYENRPQICRTQLAWLFKKYGLSYANIEMEEYLITRCKLIQALKKWKLETSCSKLHQKIITTICLTKLD